MASHGGHEKVVQMLIKAEAHIETQDKEYLFFIQRSNGICVFLLLRGRTSIRTASQEGHKKVIQMLINAGANIEAQDKK